MVNGRKEVMLTKCIYCQKQYEINPNLDKDRPITQVFCNDCYKNLIEGSSKIDIINKISSSVIIFDQTGTIKLVNEKLLEQVQKSYTEIIGSVGGEIIDCTYANQGNGCGNSPNCDQCVVKQFLTRTVETGKSFAGVKGHQISKTTKGLMQNDFMFAMEKIGNLVLLRIDKWIES